MAGTKITREVIHIISRYSNWPAKSIAYVFRSEKIYASGATWQLFLHYFLLSAGIAFSVAGIIFFFAYNWDRMHAFAKFGLLTGIILAGAGLYLYSRLRLIVRQIILTGTAIVTGALFAVYGQVYPTIAQPSELFLIWTLFTLLPAVASRFTPLWLFLFILTNTTLIVYMGENNRYWSDVEIHNMLFLTNLFFFVCLEWLYGINYFNRRPGWLQVMLMLFSTIMITVGLIIGIYGHIDAEFYIAVFFSMAYYPLIIWYGYRNRKPVYIAAAIFSLIIVAAALLIKPFENPMNIFLVVSIFIILSTTLLIRQLLRLKRNWHV